MTRSSRSGLTAVLLTAASVVLCGCGSRYDFETVAVQGIVTLDGQPLPNALVIFRSDSSRPSYGRTDASGQYHLQYLEEKAGVLPGRHHVSISTREEPDPDSDDPQKRAGRPEQVPAVYNVSSTLSVEIHADHDGPVNFELSSGGSGMNTSLTAR